jgi:hypothetical protein
MTALGPRIEHTAAAELAATRTLGVLEERRVPYARPPLPSRDASWASVRAAGSAAAVHWYVGDGAPGRWSLGALPLWCRMADDAAVEAFAASVGGGWERDEPIDGAFRTWTWRTRDGGTILPFDPDEAIANLRSERYLALRARGPSWKAIARRVYYAVRPLLPRRAQIAMRRAFTRVQARTTFPRWPAETALHDLSDLVLQRVADAAGLPVPYLRSWPSGCTWALVLTHDVETAVGRDTIERVRAIESERGYRSSWNLVPERYAVDDALVERLRATGCEVGVHGLRHDGRDLSSERNLARRLPAMRRWAERWGAVGFRSPATHRVWEWMPQLGFDYDSSYPDSDPYEPMAGGCCSWLPFFNDGLVELPITLPQDHTVFVILRRDESLWREKADLLRERGGMALMIVHPDYMDWSSLSAYARFLEAYREDPRMWTALPCEVAAWWRRRAETSLERGHDGWRAVGPAAAEAVIAYAHPADARPKPSPAARLGVPDPQIYTQQ